MPEVLLRRMSPQESAVAGVRRVKLTPRIEAQSSAGNSPGDQDVHTRSPRTHADQRDTHPQDSDAESSDAVWLKPNPRSVEGRILEAAQRRVDETQRGLEFMEQFTEGVLDGHER